KSGLEPLLQSALVFADLTANVFVEGAVELIFSEFERGFQDVRRLLLVAVAAQHVQNRVEAELVRDKFADLRRLEVTQLDVIRRFGPQEPPVKISNLCPASVVEGFDGDDAPVIAPAGPRLALLVNREPFGKPARDAVVGHLERDHMRVFVPERAAPVELAGL